jgi:hypothetical protein
MARQFVYDGRTFPDPDPRFGRQRAGERAVPEYEPLIACIPAHTVYAHRGDQE